MVSECIFDCKQESADGDSLEEGPLLDGATFHNLACQCRLQPRWHGQVLPPQPGNAM